MSKNEITEEFMKVLEEVVGHVSPQDAISIFNALKDTYGDNIIDAFDLDNDVSDTISHIISSITNFLGF